jgi:hypothetical protein
MARPRLADLATARSDLRAFAAMIAVPLRPRQAEALRLEQRTTVIVAPRRCLPTDAKTPP